MTFIEQGFDDAGFLLLTGSLWCNSMVSPNDPCTVLFEYGPPNVWGMKFTVENPATAKFASINMRLGLIAMLQTGELYCCNNEVHGIVSLLRSE
jgi:hypothetical protein